MLALGPLEAIKLTDLKRDMKYLRWTLAAIIAVQIASLIKLVC